MQNVFKSEPATVLGGKTNTANLIPCGSCLRNRSEFKIPQNIITTDDYRKKFDNLLAGAENFTNADEKFLNDIDNLDLDLQNQIIYNTDDITECAGTRYFISADGNDDADGKTPETAWRTIKKLNETELCRGDLVSFRRGDAFRGIVWARSGITYSAYGTGYKPQVLASMDATQWNWVKTETENVWKLDHEFTLGDVADYGWIDDPKIMIDLSVAVLVTPDGIETPGIRCYWLNQLTDNFKFCFCGPIYNKKGENLDGDQQRDNYIYMYCDKGNPGELFTDIEIGLNFSVFKRRDAYVEDITINNFELLYGRGPFWPSDCKNIIVTYCICGWQGGYDDGSQDVPYGGGGGVWGACDNFVWDHCYIFQQWDSGVSPQFGGQSFPTVIFKDFITTNCLFKGCKWTLEYWLHQKRNTEGKIVNMIFDYNLCRDGGYGFNELRRNESAYVESWGYESSCYDCSIAHNLFDRPYAKTYDIGGFEQIKPGTETEPPVDKFSIERMPKIKNNIHLQSMGKPFAKIKKGCEYRCGDYDLSYNFTKEDLQNYIGEGFEEDSVYLFADRK